MTKAPKKTLTMTLDDIAAEMQTSRKTALRIASQSGFPRSWKAYPGSRLRRWDRCAVERWIDEQQA